ncbi:unannotated protein [freshwater metagenome]|uniref:Signal transduction histidine-protein kinase/phosphatase MprB n=1 Tax=freshwater metagenome TaxID=449393 RepID=A0A6J7H1E3_9ZZZZ|nr:HAMP domain-containing protein [Actinomycetota bacterium]
MTRPLDHVRSLKLRLGLLIVLAIGVTLVTMLVAGALDVRLRWGALAAVVLSLGTVQVVARGTVAPVRRLQHAATRVAAGEHGVRVPVTGWDELAELTRAFNRMAEDLERTDRVRRDLVADAAHELRTPISALRAVLENAVDGVEPADPAALLAQVRRLGDLADRLLDLSQLEGGAAALHRREVAVRDLVVEAAAATGHDVVEVGRGDAGTVSAGTGDGSPASADGDRGRPRPRVAVDVPDGLTATVDPGRLAQVLVNLLGNARCHAPGAPVAVRARGTPDGGLHVEVEDRGPGLRGGDEERIFERFARADRSRSAAGSGLGLAIVRSIAELHGGTVRAEASTPRGCRIVLDLP